MILYRLFTSLVCQSLCWRLRFDTRRSRVPTLSPLKIFEGKKYRLPASCTLVQACPDMSWATALADYTNFTALNKASATFDYDEVLEAHWFVGDGTVRERSQVFGYDLLLEEMAGDSGGDGMAQRLSGDGADAERHYYQIYYNFKILIFYS